jgi:class 3 adenylate cyclase
MAGYINTKDRIEFVVLGDAVNVAFGLQAMARPNRLFIGPDTYHSIQGQFRTLDIGPMAIKGRSESVTVYEVPRCQSNMLAIPEPIAQERRPPS